MHKKTILLLHILVLILISCKEQVPTNVLVTDMCHELKNNNIEDNESALLDYFEDYCNEKNVNNERRSKVFARLIRNCDFFATSATAESYMHEDWGHSLTKPESNLKEDLLQQFIKENTLFYYGADKKVVKLQIDPTTWYEKMSDGTYSKLKLIKNGKNQFYLEFLKSNNDYKNDLSEIGDKYFYEILNYENNKYQLSSHVKERSDYYTFILYTSHPE